MKQFFNGAQNSNFFGSSGWNTANTTKQSQIRLESSNGAQITIGGSNSLNAIGLANGSYGLAKDDHGAGDVLSAVKTLQADLVARKASDLSILDARKNSIDTLKTSMDALSTASITSSLQSTETRVSSSVRSDFTNTRTTLFGQRPSPTVSSQLGGLRTTASGIVSTRTTQRNNANTGWSSITSALSTLHASESADRTSNLNLHNSYVSTNPATSVSSRLTTEKNRADTLDSNLGTQKAANSLPENWTLLSADIASKRSSIASTVTTRRDAITPILAQTPATAVSASMETQRARAAALSTKINNDRTNNYLGDTNSSQLSTAMTSRRNAANTMRNNRNNVITNIANQRPAVSVSSRLTTEKNRSDNLAATILQNKNSRSLAANWTKLSDDMISKKNSIASTVTTRRNAINPIPALAPATHVSVSMEAQRARAESLSHQINSNRSNHFLGASTNQLSAGMDAKRNSGLSSIQSRRNAIQSIANRRPSTTITSRLTTQRNRAGGSTGNLQLAAKILTDKNQNSLDSQWKRLSVDLTDKRSDMLDSISRFRSAADPIKLESNYRFNELTYNNGTLASTRLANERDRSEARAAEIRSDRANRSLGNPWNVLSTEIDSKRTQIANLIQGRRDVVEGIAALKPSSTLESRLITQRTRGQNLSTKVTADLAANPLAAPVVSTWKRLSTDLTDKRSDILDSTSRYRAASAPIELESNYRFNQLTLNSATLLSNLAQAQKMNLANLQSQIASDQLGNILTPELDPRFAGSLNTRTSAKIHQGFTKAMSEDARLRAHAADIFSRMNEITSTNISQSIDDKNVALNQRNAQRVQYTLPSHLEPRVNDSMTLLSGKIEETRLQAMSEILRLTSEFTQNRERTNTQTSESLMANREDAAARLARREFQFKAEGAQAREGFNLAEQMRITNAMIQAQMNLFEPEYEGYSSRVNVVASNALGEYRDRSDDLLVNRNDQRSDVASGNALPTELDIRFEDSAATKLSTQIDEARLAALAEAVRLREIALEIDTRIDIETSTQLEGVRVDAAQIRVDRTAEYDAIKLDESFNLSQQMAEDDQSILNTLSARRAQDAEIDLRKDDEVSRRLSSGIEDLEFILDDTDGRAKDRFDSEIDQMASASLGGVILPNSLDSRSEVPGISQDQISVQLLQARDNLLSQIHSESGWLERAEALTERTNLETSTGLEAVRLDTVNLNADRAEEFEEIELAYANELTKKDFLSLSDQISKENEWTVDFLEDRKDRFDEIDGVTNSLASSSIQNAIDQLDDLNERSESDRLASSIDTIASASAGEDLGYSLDSREGDDKIANLIDQALENATAKVSDLLADAAALSSRIDQETSANLESIRLNTSEISGDLNQQFDTYRLDAGFSLSEAMNDNRLSQIAEVDQDWDAEAGLKTRDALELLGTQTSEDLLSWHEATLAWREQSNDYRNETLDLADPENMGPSLSQNLDPRNESSYLISEQLEAKYNELFSDGSSEQELGKLPDWQGQAEDLQTRTNDDTSEKLEEIRAQANKDIQDSETQFEEDRLSSDFSVSQPMREFRDFQVEELSTTWDSYFNSPITNQSISQSLFSQISDETSEKLESWQDEAFEWRTDRDSERNQSLDGDGPALDWLLDPRNENSNLISEQIYDERSRLMQEMTAIEEAFKVMSDRDIRTQNFGFESSSDPLRIENVDLLSKALQYDGNLAINGFEISGHKINGEASEPSVAEMLAKINELTDRTGLTATAVQSRSLMLSDSALSSLSDLQEGDLRINGQAVTGSIKSAQDLEDAINSIEGLQATVVMSEAGAGVTEMIIESEDSSKTLEIEFNQKLANVFGALSRSDVQNHFLEDDKESQFAKSFGAGGIFEGKSIADLRNIEDRFDQGKMSVSQRAKIDLNYEFHTRSAVVASSEELSRVGKLKDGDFKINGVDIVGELSDLQSLVGLINQKVSQTGVQASIDNQELRLTSVNPNNPEQRNFSSIDLSLNENGARIFGSTSRTPGSEIQLTAAELNSIVDREIDFERNFKEGGLFEGLNSFTFEPDSQFVVDRLPTSFQVEGMAAFKAWAANGGVDHTVEAKAAIKLTSTADRTDEQRKRIDDFGQDMADRETEIGSDLRVQLQELENAIHIGAKNPEILSDGAERKADQILGPKQGETSNTLEGVRDEILKIRKETEEKLAQLANRIAVEPEPVVPMPKMKKPMVSDALPEPSAIKTSAKSNSEEAEKPARRSMSDVLNNREEMRENREKANAMSPVLKPFGEESSSSGFNSKASISNLMANNAATLQRASRSRVSESEKRGGSIASMANQKKVAPAEMAKKIEKSASGQPEPAVPNISRAMSELLVAGIKRSEDLLGSSTSARLAKNFMKYAEASQSGEIQNPAAEVKTPTSSESKRLEDLRAKMSANNQTSQTRQSSEEAESFVGRAEALEREMLRMKAGMDLKSAREGREKVIELRNLASQIESQNASERLRAMQALERASKSFAENMTVSRPQDVNFETASNGESSSFSLSLNSEFNINNPIQLGPDDFKILLTNEGDDGTPTSVSLPGSFQNPDSLILAIKEALSSVESSWRAELTQSQSIKFFKPNTGGDGVSESIEIQLTQQARNQIFADEESNPWQPSSQTIPIVDQNLLAIQQELQQIQGFALQQIALLSRN